MKYQIEFRHFDYDTNDYIVIEEVHHILISGVLASSKGLVIISNGKAQQVIGIGYGQQQGATAYIVKTNNK